MTFSVKEAKNKLSALIKAAESGSPQVIRRHDHEVAVVISINEWRRLNEKRPSLVEILRNSPLVGLDLDFSRRQDYPPEIDLGG